MIGELRHLLSLETETLVADGAGGFTPSWSTVAGVWGSIGAARAEEGPAADRTLASVTHRIAVRHRAGILPARRLVLGARVFRIGGVRDPDGRGRFLICDCIEEIAG